MKSSISFMKIPVAAIFSLLLSFPLWAALDVHMESIEGPFPDGPSVTETCLECHDDVAGDFMKTSHWTWMTHQKLADGREVERGKKNAINNYCISITGNWPRCTSCHAGYGWKNNSFDFSDQRNIDCLICHDTTGKYKKFPTAAGHPVYSQAKEFPPGSGKMWQPPDLAEIARNVGKPSKANCGSCHFYGGGGNGIKHGDLDSSLLNPSRDTDVHMSAEGAGMVCQDCHTTEHHDIRGNSDVVSPGGNNHFDCVDCHGTEPHTKYAKLLNKHTKKVACQTCHIPEFAKEIPTKMWWDWSKAGDKKHPVTEDKYGKETYFVKKGEFKWGKNVRPVYRWYNHTQKAVMQGDKINPSRMVYLNKPVGSRRDPSSKIYPFKMMRGKQPYDTVNKIMVTPKLFGKDAYWATFDWSSAIKLGMESSGLDYSGHYGFVKTATFWSIDHMVSPHEKALMCKDCHSKNGRLDWKALGYPEDPRQTAKKKRHEKAMHRS